MIVGIKCLANVSLEREDHAVSRPSTPENGPKGKEFASPIFPPTLPLPMATNGIGFNNPFAPWENSMSNDWNQHIARTPLQPQLSWPTSPMMADPYATSVPFWSPYFGYPNLQQPNMWSSPYQPPMVSSSFVYPPLPYGTTTDNLVGPSMLLPSMPFNHQLNLPAFQHPQPSLSTTQQTTRPPPATTDDVSSYHRGAVDPIEVSGRKRQRESSGDDSSEPTATKIKLDSSAEKEPPSQSKSPPSFPGIIISCGF